MAACSSQTLGALLLRYSKCLPQTRLDSFVVRTMGVQQELSTHLVQSRHVKLLAGFRGEVKRSGHLPQPFATAPRRQKALGHQAKILRGDHLAENTHPLLQPCDPFCRLAGTSQRPAEKNHREGPELRESMLVAQSQQLGRGGDNGRAVAARGLIITNEPQHLRQRRRVPQSARQSDGLVFEVHRSRRMAERPLNG